MTQYYTTKVSLSDGQQAKLMRTKKNSSEVNFLITKHKIKNNGNINLFLTERQVKKFNKAKANNEGIQLTISQAQIHIFRKEGPHRGLQAGKGAPRMGEMPPPISHGKGTPRIGIPPPFIVNWPKKTTRYGGKKKLTPLTNFDLFNCIKYLKIQKFNKVISREEISEIKKNGFYIINLDDLQNSGTHWVVVNNKPKLIEYFDSFGMSYPEELKQLN